MGVLLFIMIAAGVGYVYYTGRQAEKNPQKEASTMTEAPIIKDPPPPSENAPVGAAVQFLASPVKPGDNSSITITTAQKAACTISVAYSNVVSKDSGLVPKTADGHGSVSWSWTVDKTAVPGKWPVRVTCTLNKKVGYVEGYLEVTR